MHRAGAALTASLLLLASQLMPAGPAGAQQTWAVLAKTGLGGTWARACGDGPADSNWIITYYADARGQARRRAVRGDGGPDLNSTIDSAQLLTPTTFAMRIRNDDPNWGNTNGTTYDTIIEITPRGHRSLASTRIGDGKQFIKDGKFTANGNPVALFQRCK